MKKTKLSSSISRRILSLTLVLALVLSFALFAPISPTPIAEANPGGAQRPFGQTLDHGYNHARTMPTNRTQAQMNNDVADQFNRVLSHFIVDPSHNNAGSRDTFSMALRIDGGTGPVGTNGVTVCEAQGFGMVMLTKMAGAEDMLVPSNPNDFNSPRVPLRQRLRDNLPSGLRGAFGANDVTIQTYFDAMFRLMRRFPATNAPPQGRHGEYLMAWQIRGRGEAVWHINGVSISTATDGALDMTYALVAADAQWGHTGAGALPLPNGGRNRNGGNATPQDSFYLFWARGAIYQHWRTTVIQSNPSTGNPLRSLAVGNWATGGTTWRITRPSDFHFTHLRSFAGVTSGTGQNWNSVIAQTATATNAGAHATTGLLPDFLWFGTNNQWRTLTGSPSDGLEHWNESMGDQPHGQRGNTNDQRNGWNALRVPWRLGLDVLHMGASSPVNDVVRRMDNHQRTRSNTNFAGIQGGELDGSTTGWGFTGHGFSAPYLVTAATSGNAAWMTNGWNWVRTRTAGPDQYSDYFLVLSMIAASGNWWCPITPLNGPPPPPPNDTAYGFIYMFTNPVDDWAFGFNNASAGNLVEFDVTQHADHTLTLNWQNGGDGTLHATHRDIYLALPTAASSPNRLPVALHSISVNGSQVFGPVAAHTPAGARWLVDGSIGPVNITGGNANSEVNAAAFAAAGMELRTFYPAADAFTIPAGARVDITFRVGNGPPPFITPASATLLNLGGTPTLRIEGATNHAVSTLSIAFRYQSNMLNLPSTPGTAPSSGNFRIDKNLSNIPTERFGSWIDVLISSPAGTQVVASSLATNQSITVGDFTYRFEQWNNELKVVRTANEATFTYGDVNSDSVINAADVTMLRRYIASVNRANFHNTSAGANFSLANSDANGDGYVNSTDVTLIRRWLAAPAGNRPPLGLPAITSQPEHTARAAGQSAAFSVSVAANGNPAPTFQWQVSTNGGTSWNNVTAANYPGVTGITAATLTIPNTTTAMNGHHFRAVITNLNGTTTSASRILTVTPANNSQFSISLTFDDGPNTGVANGTVGVLNALARHNARATFFVNAMHFVDGPMPSGPTTNFTFRPAQRNILLRMVDEGHTVENHSWNHARFDNTMTAQAGINNINRTSDAIQAAVGRRPLYFRPPFFALGTGASQSPLPLIHSGLDTNDWDSTVATSAQAIANVVLDMARSRPNNGGAHGAIVLQHDGPTSLQVQRTIGALDIMIPQMQNWGYEFVTLCEIFERQNVTPRLYNGVWGNIVQWATHNNARP